MGHIHTNLGGLLQVTGLSQSRLARRAGLRPGTVHAFANDRLQGIHFVTLTKVLDALWDEIGTPFGIEDILVYERLVTEVKEDGTRVVTDQYGVQEVFTPDGRVVCKVPKSL